VGDTRKAFGSLLQRLSKRSFVRAARGRWPFKPEKSFCLGRVWPRGRGSFPPRRAKSDGTVFTMNRRRGCGQTGQARPSRHRLKGGIKIAMRTGFQTLQLATFGSDEFWGSPPSTRKSTVRHRSRLLRNLPKFLYGAFCISSPVNLICPVIVPARIVARSLAQRNFVETRRYAELLRGVLFSRP